MRFTNTYTQTASTLNLNGKTLIANTLNIQSGNLIGSGTITANIINGGILTPGTPLGVLTIKGNYTQTATGILNIELGGLTPGDEYDRLSIDGNATLDGTLKIDLANDFTPASYSTPWLETSPPLKDSTSSTFKSKAIAGA